MVTDALKRFASMITSKSLFIPYFPYGRQDRVDSLNGVGESLSVKVLADMVNNLGYNHVFIADCHSDVTRALINGIQEIPQWGIIEAWSEFKEAIKDASLVSADAGANKKIFDLAKLLNKDGFIRADKKRDIATGKILETIVLADDLGGKTVAIVDDLADGSYTFTQLAKALKAKGAAKVILYVTHGIFSKGFDVVFDNGIDEVWTTNAFRTDITDPRVKVLDLDKLIFGIE